VVTDPCSSDWTLTLCVRRSEKWISSVSSYTWRALRSGLVVVSIAVAMIGGTNGRSHRAAALVTSGIVGISEEP